MKFAKRDAMLTRRTSKKISTLYKDKLLLFNLKKQTHGKIC